MMKKIIAVMLALVLCFGLCACSAEKDDKETEKENTTVTTTEALSESDTNEDAEITQPSDTVPPVKAEGVTPLLYKVTDADGDVIWLFGSVHVGREDFYPLPDYVLNAYNSSDAVAVEFDIIAYQNDTEAQINSMTHLVYRDGTKISDHISAENYNAGVEILKEYGVYSAALDYYCPAMWSSLIDSIIIEKLGADATLGIDMYILTEAYEDGKEIREIESADFQYTMLASFSDELQEIMLESSIEGMSDIDAYGQELNMLMDYWASGDEQSFYECLSSEEALEVLPAELYEEYNNAMTVERNNSMTEYAVDALASGDEVFICVGAAHIIGDGAIAENLRELGYTVEVVR